LQNRYVGDIGDYFKYSLLRCLGEDRNLGIAWYLYPDEDSDGNGNHVGYLDRPDQWRRLDPIVFDVLVDCVRSSQRSVAAIEDSGLFAKATFASELLNIDVQDRGERLMPERPVPQDMDDIGRGAI
jgi:hypothetical protein